MPSIKWTVSYSVSAFVKAHGLAFDSEPNNTTIAATGSNQTFTWKLSLGEKDKSKQLQVQFGPWDRKYKIVKSFFMTVRQEPSGGNETVAREDQSTARRLHWNGDLSRDYYIAFELVNIQRKDAGDYGMRLRVDHFPPTISQNWFSLIVQVRRIFFQTDNGKIPPSPPPCLRSYNQFCDCFFVEFRYWNWTSFIEFPILLRWSPGYPWPYGSSKMASLSLYMTWCRDIYVAISTKYTNINPCKDLYSLFVNFRSYMKLLNDARYMDD